ncbi:AAA family ATPase [Parasediminibacterium sp. JCM 36343]|uniref:AAA family ATPase n=1 Tax=Parasediminibacterium sp. JCM 36343 TaxID=3374279 RepID=UPI00397A589D
MQGIKKIVIIGPESTGKSTLSELLAKHYHTVWCPEYAREYLLEHGTDYTFDDLLTIAKGQLALQKEYETLVLNTEQKKGSSRLLFIDTDMHVMKVWCEFVFGQCHAFIEEAIKKQQCDLYLLCNIDLPWVADELREYPDEGPRIELHAIYKHILENQPVPWVDISGNYKQRLQKAIDAADTTFGLPHRNIGT